MIYGLFCYSSSSCLFCGLNSCSPFYDSCLFIFQTVLLVFRLAIAIAMVFIRDFYGWAGLTLMLHDVFVSMVMFLFFKRCFQTSSFHSCGYFQRFVSFSSDWIDGLWIGKAVRAQLAKDQRIQG